jgi:8-oxo-dGTP pyrophosphatase MutT (NUDIX family)
MGNEISTNDGGLSNPVSAPTPNAWLELLKKGWNEWLPSLKKWGKFALSRYFVEESLIKAFLEKTALDDIGKTNFINYDAWLRYYPEKAMRVACKSGQTPFEVVLPYQEIVDFVSNPKTSISVNPDIKNYESSAELKQLTQEAFDKYIESKPHTTDDPIVRLAQLQIDEQNYSAPLSRSTYFEQVRTNLTLDYLMKGGRTLRAIDFEVANDLPEFKKSKMVNSIGVSGVVYFSRGTQKYIFAKLRKGTEGIFGLMFGTTSGVVELSDSTPSDLVDLASNDMLREFREETGVSEQDATAVTITPLAFVRELMRGGKPQFFFLIEVPEELEANFKEGFKSSRDGLKEFHDSVWNKASSYQHVLSPEFAANIYYAYRYFNKQAALPVEPVNI